MTYYFDQHYKCGDKKFHNIYQAFDEQISSGQFPEYMVDQETLPEYLWKVIIIMDGTV